MNRYRRPLILLQLQSRYPPGEAVARWVGTHVIYEQEVAISNMVRVTHVFNLVGLGAN